MKAMMLAAAAALLCCALPAAAVISGSSTASMCGEAGNWIDITFTSDEGVTLVDAWWDFNGTIVWLDADGSSQCGMINEGVTDFDFYFDGPLGVDTQDFGLTATGFDSGDYFRFVMDLDRGSGGSGSPFTSDYYGGTVTVEFSDGTILEGTFDTPFEAPNGATAGFTNLGAMPDFALTTKPGWAGPLVPRGVGDASWTSVPAPVTLLGDAEETWINAVTQNVGTALAGASHLDIHLDGSFLERRNLWTVAPGEWNGSTNIGPFTVPGGRHVLRVTADVLDAVSESDETNNVFAVQYCWQGAELAPLTNETRPAPPLHDQDDEYAGLSWWNCDGMRVVPSPSYDWCAVWGERVADDGRNNYLLRLHPASSDPETAFGTNFGVSSGDENLQVLIMNTHTFGSGPWDVGVMRFEGPEVDYRLGHMHESPYPFDFGVDPVTPYFATRMMMFQFHVGPGDLGPATLVARTDPEDGPVRMGWLPPTFTDGNLEDLQDPVATDAEGVATIDLDLTVTGEYCCVVYANRAEHPGGLAVNVGLYGPKPDLEPVTLTGWHAPIVPRPAPDALLLDCAAPDTLHGNAASTWLNTACTNGGTVAADTVSFSLRIDGRARLGIRNFWTPLNPGLPRTVLNQELSGSPWTIPGGRHTLSCELDYLDELAESVEANNWTGRQYCWSPLVVPAGAVAARPELPARDGGHADCDGPDPVAPNCDGLRVERSVLGKNGWWRTLAVMPSAAGRDIDLQLHEPLSGAFDGFGPAPLAESASAAGEIEFVLVNDHNADPVPFDYGVLDGPGNLGAGYTAQAAASAFRGAVSPGMDGPYTMPAGEMIHLHEYTFAAGTVLITLNDLRGGVDWGLSVYGAASFHAKDAALPGGLAVDAPAGASETVLVDIHAPGNYCVAVWKRSAGELDKLADYRLWFAPGVSGAGEATELPPVATCLVGAAPNPFNPSTTLTFDLERDGPCSVTLHDLQGRRVRTLVAADLPAGRHQTVWDGRDAAGRRTASGTYLARLQAAGRTDLLKVMLVK